MDVDRSGGHRYPRSARLSEILREVIAEELVRIDDERLALVTITAIDVDNELNRAIVYFDSLDGEDADPSILEVLGEHRRRIQSSINRQMRAKKTPVLEFRPDDVIRAGRAHRGHPARRSPLDRDATVSRRRPPTVHGLAIVDKPAGVTSHDVVGLLRRRLGERRIGHAGTLDPGATGVLVVGVGNVTRLLRFVGDGRKRYVGEVVLGVETDSLDADGAVVATYDMAGVTVDDARRAVAAHLIGDIEQVPPMVSAIQVGGRRLHELAREGIEVERAARPVTVDRFDVDATDEPGVLAIDVTCSGGTYIRSLAADLGRLLGGGAHLRRLRRIAVGPYTIDEAAPPDVCALLDPLEAVRGMDVVAVDDDTAALVATGRVLPAPTGDGPWALVDPTDRLLAVYEPFGDGQAKPAVVLAGA